MRHNWEIDELIEHFTLTTSELDLLGNKSGQTHYGFAVLGKSTSPHTFANFSSPESRNKGLTISEAQKEYTEVMRQFPM